MRPGCVRKSPLVFLALAVSALSAEARPYRAFNTRTPRSTQGGNLEIGMRYQGLLLGEGNGIVDPWDFHQLAATLRWGIVDALELDLEAGGLLFQNEAGDLEGALGDVRLAAQVQLVRSPTARLGLLGGATFPTGPSAEDILPPHFHDGTLDAEGLLLLELSPGRTFRLLLDGGYLFQGARDRGGQGDFNGPDALRYDLALGLHLGERLLLLLELNGRHYLDPQITPVWVDNQDILELSPGLRVETSPGWVFEVGGGFFLNEDSTEIHRFRVQAGFTYEFSAH